MSLFNHHSNSFLANSLLLRDRSLSVETSLVQATAHIVSHVTGVGSLGNVLLLEAFAWELLDITLVVWTTTHAILEAFGVANRATGSVLLKAWCTSGAWTNWHTGTCLGVATLHVISSLSHNSWAWFELLYWLSVANSRLVLTTWLLVGIVCLVLLFIHICTWMKCSGRPIITKRPRISSWLLYFVLIHISRGSHTHCRTWFLLHVALICSLCWHEVASIILLIRFGLGV